MKNLLRYSRRIFSMFLRYAICIFYLCLHLKMWIIIRNIKIHILVGRKGQSHWKRGRHVEKVARVQWCRRRRRRRRRRQGALQAAKIFNLRLTTPLVHKMIQESNTKSQPWGRLSTYCTRTLSPAVLRGYGYAYSAFPLCTCWRV